MAATTNPPRLPLGFLRDQMVQAVAAGVTDVLRFIWLAGLLTLATCSTPTAQARHASNVFAPAPGSDGAGGGM
jgi:hypothetical protein